MKIISTLIKLTILALVIFFVMYKYNVNTDVEVSTAEAQKFVIAKGETVSDIAQNLAEQGLIKSEFWFKVFVKQAKEQASLQAGEYMIDGNVDIKKIVAMLSAGEVVDQEKIFLIKEGLSNKEMEAELTEQGLPNCSSIFGVQVKNLSTDYQIYSFLKEVPAGNDLEGFLFPDTYKIFATAGCEDLMIRMLNNFEQKVNDDLKQEIKRQGKTLYEVIIIASLLEKEVRSEKDMKIVSGIFWDRISNRQPLQSCATLAYILGENKPQYTVEDTKIQSPYNTYQNQGLPPSPVSNPGLQAIQAAVYPTETNYNYFLSRPDTGETIFSKTYDEHIQNKAKYLD
ncbi:MAG: endolytic transglycosylase MltG [bacterium]